MRIHHRILIHCVAWLTCAPLVAQVSHGSDLQSKAQQVVTQYCLDCHNGEYDEGGPDLTELFTQTEFDRTLLFENVATNKMPPAAASQPSVSERIIFLKWLAAGQRHQQSPAFRRLGRYEFVYAVNDLLGTNQNLADQIPDDRGTHDFDTDRRIQLSSEALDSYFSVADQLLEHAFPADGVPDEQVWITSKLRDSHYSYNVYTRDYKDGVLFSWTRANNGNSYSFFYDNFDPPAAGWYELTFEAAKVGEFKEDISIQIHAGRYYYADDRPQPQRLLDVLSVGSSELQPYRTRVFLKPGENLSVHCYSHHTFRQEPPEEGVYIRQLTVQGPLQDQWPPSSFQTVFDGLHIAAPPRTTVTRAGFVSNLKRIGGTLAVSSYQQGREKTHMQDGSNRSFWHSRFSPTPADPPHYVILENPNKATIDGLSYATWSGGNGNGQVREYSILVSDDGQTWDQLTKGDLEVRLANEQPIQFPTPTNKRFIKFLVTDALSLDGKSVASIGKLDVVVSLPKEVPRTTVTVPSASAQDLRQVIRRFARRAFVSSISDDELAPYLDVSLRSMQEHGDFIRAAQFGFKSIICSPRFLMVPGEHTSTSFTRAAKLSRILWLSGPDQNLLQLAATDELSGQTLVDQIDRLIQDERSDRMIQSFCDQWLNLRSWDKVAPSLKLYPEYDDLLNHYLPIETQAYLAHLIRTNQPASHLIDSDYSFLNQRLARHYGIHNIVGQNLRKVSFGENVARGGLLTMGSVLKVSTDGFDTSPILRGAWVSKNIVGMPVSPPPEPVKAIEPQHNDPATTLREQIEQHKTSPACYACHKNIDPYGFALENFDATGHWRNKYRVEDPHQGTFQFRRDGYFHLADHVNASGEVDDLPFRNIFELKKILLSRRTSITYNFAKKFFEYAHGIQPSLTQRITLLDMVTNGATECRLKDLVTQILVDSLNGEHQ